MTASDKNLSGESPGRHAALRAVLVRILRSGFRWWPFMHGRGWLVRLSHVLLGKGPVLFDIGGGTWIEGCLDDWMILWAYMRAHEKDEGFQRSVGLVREKSVVFDVGAHVGIWSLLAARRNPTARIHAFEPVPEHAARLRAHAVRNRTDGIEVNPFAVAGENGNVTFFAVREGNTGLSSLRRRSARDEEIHVAAKTLDRYVSERSLESVDVMKVDVEGAELLVFSGAQVLLASATAPAIFFEVNDSLCASFNVSSRDLKRLLEGHGYGIYRWRDSRFIHVPTEEIHSHEDLFALKTRHLQQLREL